MTAPRQLFSDEAGFTLIETLVALALMGLILSALGTLTAQWLPNWNRGIDRLARSEWVGIAMQRISADLAAAEFVTANREQKHLLFDGTELAVTFVRSALGPNTPIGLDVVRIGEMTDKHDLVTVRTRAPFAPLASGATLSERLMLDNPVVLLKPPLRVSFTYAGPDHAWKSTWRDADKLPETVQVTVRDTASERVLAVSTVATLHVDAPAPGSNTVPAAQMPTRGNKDDVAPNAAARRQGGGS